MHSLNTAYTLCYNLRHRRSGPLAQGRYIKQLHAYKKQEDARLRVERGRLNPTFAVKKIERWAATVYGSSGTTLSRIGARSDRSSF